MSIYTSIRTFRLLGSVAECTVTVPQSPFSRRAGGMPLAQTLGQGHPDRSSKTDRHLAAAGVSLVSVMDLPSALTWPVALTLPPALFSRPAKVGFAIS